VAYQSLGRVASVRVRRKRCWWAFTFPLGAYTASTLALGRAWNSSLLASFAVLLFVSLSIPLDRRDVRHAVCHTLGRDLAPLSGPPATTYSLEENLFREDRDCHR
jgi:hypothetical protein